MAIRFACQCGKRLRAPDKMAGRRTQCPSCFSSVLIPRRWSLGRLFEPRHPGRPSENRTDPQGEPTSPALPPASRGEVIVTDLAGRSPGGPPSGASTFVPIRTPSAGLDPEATAIALRRPPRWTRLLSARVEPRWYHSLVFPASNVPIFFRLALMLTCLTAFALLGWLSIDRDRPAMWPYVILGISLFLLLLVLGRTLNYFNAILALAAQGKVKHDAAIDFAPIRALLSCGQWLACFLAGPALLFGSALGYWLYWGDLTVIDWLILAELGLVGVGWWLIAILLTNVEGAARLPSPGHVLRTALRLGIKAIEIDLLATAVFLAHLFAAIHGIGHLHDQPVFSFVLLCTAATTGLYLTAFTFRRLGLTYHRLERKRHAKEAMAPDGLGDVVGAVQTWPE